LQIASPKRTTNGVTTPTSYQMTRANLKSYWYRDRSSGEFSTSKMLDMQRLRNSSNLELIMHNIYVRLGIVSSKADLNQRLAYDLLRTEDLDGSEPTFHDLLRRQQTTEDVRRRGKLHASSGMAHIHFCRQYFGAAESWCKRSLVSRRRLVGKNNPFYSTALSSILSFHEGKDDLAAAAMI